MAAIFQLRRGSGSVSLQDGELYVNKGIDSLQYAVGEREITLAKLDELNTGSLYLSGDENPRRSIEENSMVPEKFKKWYMSKLRYRTIHSLMNNYPETLNIPQSIIDKEIQFFEEEVYNYMIENMLDPRNTNTVEVLDHAYKSFTYQDKKNKNNSVDDIIRKYFATQEEDTVAIKDYLKSMMQPMIARKEED